MTVKQREIPMRIRRLVSAITTEALILGMLAGPALAQQTTNGGGGDAPFAPGITTGLTWVHFMAAAIAVAGLVIGCIMLFMRQIMPAVGAFVFIVVGGALLANANTIITQLTGLSFG